LESGGLEFAEAAQSLNNIEVAGLPYEADGGRLRQFGGTTNLWGGWCRPLDEMDFKVRDWIPHSGWPFDRSHLLPYYERAHQICQIGPFDYDPESWGAADENRTLIQTRRLISKMFQISPPTRFGSIYREEISRAENITTIYHATVTDLNVSTYENEITGVRAVDLSGRQINVKATIYILATGGIENARLLLNSGDVNTGGLGNSRDLVGRYFMGHPELIPAWIGIRGAPSRYSFYRQHEAIVGGEKHQLTGAISFTDQVFESSRLANFTTELIPFNRADAAKNSASRLREELGEEGWLKLMGNTIYSATADLWDNLFDENLSYYLLETASEQIPNPNSRVHLSHDVDALGKRKAVLDWRLSDQDRDTVLKSCEIIGMELGASDLGRLMMTVGDNLSEWSIWGKHHHMGTTRMHNDPKQGVVTENSRVHGIENLYLAGSSVFPTSGSATPTLTIVALALRLADLIKARLRTN
jgi:choline dehydrogenase-like flavoprotein